MAAAAILNFQVMWIWLFRGVVSVVFVFRTKFGKNICYRHWDPRTCFRPSFDDVTRINFRFRLLVMWSSPHGRGASSNITWCRYLYLVRSYWHFSEIQDGGRRHLGFSVYVNLAIPACWQCGICVLYQIWFIDISEIDARMLQTYIWWRHAN